MRTNLAKLNQSANWSISWFWFLLWLNLYAWDKCDSITGPSCYVFSSTADNHDLKRGNKNFDGYKSKIVMKPNCSETSFLFLEVIQLTNSWRTACTSPILKNSTTAITHATRVNVCVDGHLNHLGAMNSLWVQEHGIKPQSDRRRACVLINANQINWQHVSHCFRSVSGSVPQPRTWLLLCGSTSCWPRRQRECGRKAFQRQRLK